jgi:hypothetical protein
MTNQFLTGAAALSLLAAGSATAQVTFVADPASLAALGSLTSLPVDPSQDNQLSSVLGDTVFSVTGALPLDYFTGGFGASRPFLLNSSTAHAMTISLTGSYQLAGFHFGRFDPGTVIQPIRVNTNFASYDFTVPMGSIFSGAAFTFAGFATSGAERITSVAFAGEDTLSIGTSVAMAEVQYGNPGAVPEPSSWAMLLAGFGLIGAMVRRRRQVAVVSA